MNLKSLFFVSYISSIVVYKIFANICDKQIFINKFFYYINFRSKFTGKYIFFMCFFYLNSLLYYNKSSYFLSYSYNVPLIYLFFFVFGKEILILHTSFETKVQSSTNYSPKIQLFVFYIINFF